MQFRKVAPEKGVIGYDHPIGPVRFDVPVECVMLLPDEPAVARLIVTQIARRYGVLVRYIYSPNKDTRNVRARRAAIRAVQAATGWSTGELAHFFRVSWRTIVDAMGGAR